MEKNCGHCRTPFNAQVPWAEYCSRRCYGRAKSARYALRQRLLYPADQRPGSVAAPCLTLKVGEVCVIPWIDGGEMPHDGRPARMPDEAKNRTIGRAVQRIARGQGWKLVTQGSAAGLRVTRTE